MELTGPLLSPSSKKLKKICPEKKFLYFRKWSFLAQKKLKNFLVSKNLIKTFYTLDKTPLGETGCLSNLYYLLAAQSSSFLIHHPFPNTVS